MNDTAVLMECIFCGHDFTSTSGMCPECGMVNSYEAALELAVEASLESE